MAWTGAITNVQPRDTHRQDVTDGLWWWWWCGGARWSIRPGVQQSWRCAVCRHNQLRKYSKQMWLGRHSGRQWLPVTAVLPQPTSSCPMSQLVVIRSSNCRAFHYSTSVASHCTSRFACNAARLGYTTSSAIEVISVQSIRAEFWGQGRIYGSSMACKQFGLCLVLIWER